jgi:hypothetical protein
VGPELHVAHEPASPFQQAIRIGNLGATKEPDINVGPEGIDIRECGITYTCGWLAIMQQLSNLVSAATHEFEPPPRDRPQFAGMLVHPDVDPWISLD